MEHGPNCNLWLRDALTAKELAALDGIAGTAGRPGGRIDWREPDIAATLEPITAVIRKHALPCPRLVRVVWFTKDTGANWGVPWHQDRIIAVAERHDVPGFINWSQKGGIWHCEPPVETFAQMRFVRVHLDDCDAENGAMEIACGSETVGLVAESEAVSIADNFRTELCSAQRGDIQILPMLVLHRSRRARTNAARRALRLDYAAHDLPSPLQWCTP